MKLRNMRTAVVAVLVALGMSACGSGGATEMKEVASQNAGSVRVALLSESGDLIQGKNRFRMVFRSATGDQPVDAGSVTVSSSMLMPGMAPMVAPMELEPAGETGQYSLTGSFSMSGAWQFEVRWDGPAGRGSTSFNVNVR